MEQDPSNKELSQQIERLALSVANGFEKAEQERQAVERRLDGQIRQALTIVASIQGQVSGIEGDLKKLRRDVVDVQREVLNP